MSAIGYKVTITQRGLDGCTPKWVTSSPVKVTDPLLGITYQHLDEVTQVTVTSHTADYAVETALDLVRRERALRAESMKAAIAAHEKEWGL